MIIIIIANKHLVNCDCLLLRVSCGPSSKVPQSIVCSFFLSVRTCSREPAAACYPTVTLPQSSVFL